MRSTRPGRTLFLALVLGFGEMVGSHAATPPGAGAGGVDLHTHLMMKEGMGFLLAGSPDEPPRSSHWKGRLSTKLSFENLEKTNLSITVVALYAHPWITAMSSVEENLKVQIEQLEAWVAKNPKWVIAGSAAEAREALRKGKRVLVLSIEGAHGLFEKESQLAYWIDSKKIRIVTFLHLTTDPLGGPALYNGIGILNSPIAWMKSFFSGERDPFGVVVNTQGLTPQGREVAEGLMNRGVWIDLSHSSDRAQKELFPRMKTAGQPALYTHTVLRKYYRAERGISEEQLGWVKESGGVLGLMPAADMITPKDGTASGQTCTTGFGALSTHWLAASMTTDDSAVLLGSDFNAPLQGLAPECLNKSLQGAIEEAGFHRAEQVPFLFKALNETPERLAAKTERFLTAWEKVKPQPGAP